MPDEILNSSFYKEQLILNSLECICSSDANGNIFEFNPAAEKVFGYSKEEVVSKGIGILYASEKELQRISETLEKRGRYIGEVVNKRKNGEIFVSFLSANIIFDAEGNQIGTMGISHDITKEKELVREVEKNKNEKEGLITEIQELSQIATSITNGIYITDKNDKVLWSNAGFLKMTGYELDDFKGKKPSEVLRIPHFYEETFNRIANSGPVYPKAVQIPIYTKGGELIWMLVETTAVLDEDGLLDQVIGVCTEITAQKKAEMALQESEQNFRKISETIDDVFYLYNIFDMEYEYMSPKCIDVLGVPQEFFFDGKQFIDLIHEDDRHIFKRCLIGLKNRQSFDVEYRLVIDGKIRWIHERGYPVIDNDGRVIKRSGICSDITKDKYTRELLDKQNRDINESIEYARLIQEATLTSESDVKEIFEDSFVLYKPMNILSGDFYIVDKMKSNAGNDLIAFIVADCTGHGVPGAILSILCNSLLKQTFSNQNVNSPGEALNVVRDQLIKSFQTKSTDQMRDGMDVGFGVLDITSNKIYYAGANMSCYVARDGKLIEIKGDRHHVGYGSEGISFTDHQMDYEKGDVIYLATDGFVDQFGGDKNKRYMSKRLQILMKKVAILPISEQEELFLSEFEEWKGDNDQTDDMCLLGFRI